MLNWSVLLKTFQGHHTTHFAATSFIKWARFSCTVGLFQAAAATQSSSRSSISQNNTKHPALWVKFKQSKAGGYSGFGFPAMLARPCPSKQCLAQICRAFSIWRLRQASLTFAECRSVPADSDSSLTCLGVPANPERQECSPLGTQRFANLALIPWSDLWNSAVSERQLCSLSYQSFSLSWLVFLWLGI